MVFVGFGVLESLGLFLNIGTQVVFVLRFFDLIDP